MKIPAYALAVAATLALGATNAHAACSPQNATQLKQLLEQHSPFSGRWSYGGNGGPTKISVNGNQVSWTPTGQGKRTTKIKIINRNTFSFNAGAGTTILRLDGGCKLSGIQKYADKGVVYDVEWVLQ